MSRAVSIPATELPPGQRRLVFVEGRSLVLFNINGTVYAIDNTCPHQGASLAGGRPASSWGAFVKLAASACTCQWCAAALFWSGARGGRRDMVGAT